MFFPWLDAVVRDATGSLPPAAEAYLASRGVTREEAVAHRVGWLPSTYAVQRCSPAFGEWQRWMLRDRLIFPVTSPLGTVVGLQSRKLDEKTYHQFYAGSRDVYIPVFGLDLSADAIYTTQQAVLVEGIFDYFAVRAAGVRNAVAILGAHPTRAILRFLDRYVRRVFILTDMDETGRQSATRLVAGKRTWDAVAPTYPSHDPADWLAGGGLPDMQRLLAPATRPYGSWN